MPTVTSANREEFVKKEMAKRNPTYDNQGRDLAGVKKHFDNLTAMSEEGRKRATEQYERTIKDVPLPDWTEVNGVKVLRSGEASHIGVPANGKETASHYDVIHWPKKEFITKLKKHEIHHWLHATAKNEFEEKHGRPAGSKK
jgi:hypothetical protein